MSESTIHEIILDIVRMYGDANYGLTEKEIIAQMQDKYPQDEVRSAIHQLLDDEHLIHQNDTSPSQFNLPERIEKPAWHDDDEKAERLSDLWLEDEAIRAVSSKKILEKIAQKSVLYDLAESYTSEENFAISVLNIATQIADEDPIELLLQMAEWVVDDINQLAEDLAIRVADQPKLVRKVSRELGFRVKKAERLFQRLFRLDDDDILTIPTIQNMQRRNARVKLNKDKARKRLSERIHGSHFINMVEVPQNTHKCAVGTDASVGDISITHVRGSFIPPTPASLFIAGAAMRVIQRNGDATSQQYWDYDIDPREIEVYVEEEAAEEGLFISPRLKGEVITDFQHLSIAAMELRQYLEELRIVNQQAHWHPFGDVPELGIPPKIGLIFRDGRIFPLVHRIEDYEGASAPDDILYGLIVRKEVDTFFNVFHNTVGRGQSGATYAGAVKAPAFSWLSMIVFWYLYKTTGDKTFKTTFYRPPLNDQAVSHLLFWGICKANPAITEGDSRYALTTFQTIRRFSDIAFSSHPLVYQEDDKEFYVDEDSAKSWEKYFEYHIAEVEKSHRAHRRGVPSLGDIKEYADFIELCRRASVSMFYATPCRVYKATIRDNAHALLPRWEVAIDASQSDLANIT